MKVVDEYKLKINNSHDLNYDLIEQQVKIVNSERKRIISEYESKRKQAFKDFTRERDDVFSGQNLTFYIAYFYTEASENTNEQYEVARLEDYLDIEVAAHRCLTECGIMFAQAEIQDAKVQQEREEVYKNKDKVLQDLINEYKKSLTPKEGIKVSINNSIKQSTTVSEPSSAYTSDLSMFGTRRNSAPSHIASDTKFDTPTFTS